MCSLTRICFVFTSLSSSPTRRTLVNMFRTMSRALSSSPRICAIAKAVTTSTTIATRANATRTSWRLLPTSTRWPPRWVNRRSFADPITGNSSAPFAGFNVRRRTSDQV